MKTILIVLPLVVVSVASFAQGKITIGNDANHLVVDRFEVPISQAGGWDIYTMQLWGGTSVGSMTLQTSFVGAAIGNPAFNDGRVANTPMTLVGIPGGAVATLQLRFFRTSDILPIGVTPIFTVTAGSFAPFSIVLGPPGGTSTWAAGNVRLDPLPEPSSFSLAAVGAICLLKFRRRRRRLPAR